MEHTIRRKLGDTIAARRRELDLTSRAVAERMVPSDTTDRAAAVVKAHDLIRKLESKAQSREDVYVGQVATIAAAINMRPDELIRRITGHQIRWDEVPEALQQRDLGPMDWRDIDSVWAWMEVAAELATQRRAAEARVAELEAELAAMR